jgi:hypothetical protein
MKRSTTSFGDSMRRIAFSCCGGLTAPSAFDADPVRSTFAPPAVGGVGVRVGVATGRVMQQLCELAVSPVVVDNDEDAFVAKDALDLEQPGLDAVPEGVCEPCGCDVMLRASIGSRFRRAHSDLNVIDGVAAVGRTPQQLRIRFHPDHPRARLIERWHSSGALSGVRVHQPRRWAATP